MFGATSCSRLKGTEIRNFAKPYCQCWNKNEPISRRHIIPCTCGEDNEVSEWKWECPEDNYSRSSWVVVSEDRKEVSFHPYYSSGTAAAKGDSPLVLNHHYYWEIKILTETYGTDIMVGVGTNKVNMNNARFKFTSLLGEDGESYGLSYRGVVRHNAMVSRDSNGFCCGTIVGVRLDMWRGTLEFYINRKPQGVSFYNLRRHQALFPMVCSTAAKSSMRLIYAASWRASLLVDAAKILASSLHDQTRLPPGLSFTCRSQFWLMLPSDGGDLNEDSDDDEMMMQPVRVTTNVLNDVIPSHYVSGFFVDTMDTNYQVVVWE